MSKPKNNKHFLYLITFDKADYEEDISFVVSAINVEHALIVGQVKDGDYNPTHNWSNRFRGNIKSIQKIGTYYKNYAEEVICNNRGS